MAVAVGQPLPAQLPPPTSARRGPSRYWRGKDVSGEATKQIARFNAANPGETVTLHELPDNADAQRQQMIQNSQIKNAKMAHLER